MIPSASGVLRTRCPPNSFTRSARVVATPSPNMTTRASRRISSARARPIASLTVIFCISRSSGVNVGSELGQRGKGRGLREVERVLDPAPDAFVHGGDLRLRDRAGDQHLFLKPLDRVAR